MVNPHWIFLKVRMGQSSAFAFQAHPRHEQAQVGAIPRGKDPSFVPQHKEEEKPHPCTGLWCQIHAQSISWHKEEQRNESTGIGEVQEGKDGTPRFLMGLSAEQGLVVKQKWEKKGKILQKNTKISTLFGDVWRALPLKSRWVHSSGIQAGRGRWKQRDKRCWILH